VCVVVCGGSVCVGRQCVCVCVCGKRCGVCSVGGWCAAAWCVWVWSEVPGVGNGVVCVVGWEPATRLCGGPGGGGATRVGGVGLANQPVQRQRVRVVAGCVVV